MRDVSSDFDIYKNYYNSLMQESDDSNIVGSWGGVSQDRRYEELIDKDIFEDAAIVEVECGIGGFLDYLLNSGVSIKKYVGLDILPEMQRMNENKYPQYRFITRNIIAEPLEEKFDVVVMCGVFHLKTMNGKDYMEQLLKSAWECCTGLMTFNFISSYVNYTDDNTEYHDPIDVFRFCINELSPVAFMKHHYWKCDTSIKVYRE